MASFQLPARLSTCPVHYYPGPSGLCSVSNSQILPLLLPRGWPGPTSPPTRPLLLEARASVSSARRHHPHIYHRLSNWPLAYLPSFGAMQFTISYAPVAAMPSLHKLDKQHASLAIHRASSKLLFQPPSRCSCGSLSALGRPRGCWCARGGVFSPIFPCDDNQHRSTLRVPSYRALCCLCPVAVTVRLASCPVSLWVVCLASREPVRPCRASDFFTSRHHQSGRSVEKFLPTSGLLSPQTPTLPPSRRLGFQGVGSHASNKRACMLSLDWSPCGWRQPRI